jgi:glycosyltransferase involved in cell wall biosynthesis
VKIGLIIYGELQDLSGGYLYDRKLVEHLREQGDHLHLFSLPWRGYARHLLDNFASELLSRVRDADLDLLLQDELNHPSLFWLNRRLRGQTGLPLVAIVHHLRSSEPHPPPLRRIYRWIEAGYLRGVQGALFNTHTTLKQTHAARGDPLPSLVAYPAGDHLGAEISAAEIRARALTQGKLRLIFVGNLVPRKGLHVLLEALRGALGRSVLLRVVGDLNRDPAYAQRIRARIRELALEGAVSLLGVRREASLRAALRDSDLFVLPSFYEGFGIAYLEAMSFGLPVIATSAGGAAELVREDVNGRVVPPGQPSALAAAIEGFLQDRSRLVKQGIAARRSYEAHPTWAETFREVRPFLGRIIEEYSTPHSPKDPRHKGASP